MGLKGFDDGASSGQGQLRWFGKEGCLKCTTNSAMEINRFLPWSSAVKRLTVLDRDGVRQNLPNIPNILNIQNGAFLEPKIQCPKLPIFS